MLRYDDRPVHKFTVLDHIPTRLTVEQTPYPKTGDPNPLVKLGVVAAGGGDIRWADLSNYSETSSLLLRAGVLTSEVGAKFSLAEIQTAVKQAEQPGRHGKVLLQIR